MDKLGFVREELFPALGKVHDKVTETRSKVEKVNSLNVKTGAEQRFFGLELKNTSRFRVPGLSSSVKSTKSSPNNSFNRNTYIPNSDPTSTLLQNYSPRNKDVFYGTFKICHEIDSTIDFHEFIHKTGNRRKVDTAESNTVTGSVLGSFLGSTLGPIVSSFFNTPYIDTPNLSMNLVQKTKIIETNTALAEQQVNFLRISILNYYENHRGFYTHSFRIILQNLTNADDEKDKNHGISEFELEKAVHGTAHFLWKYYGYVLLWVQMLASYQDDQFFFPMAIAARKSSCYRSGLLIGILLVILSNLFLNFQIFREKVEPLPK